MGYPYLAYRTITKEQAFARGFDGAWLNVAKDGEEAIPDYELARDIFEQYPKAQIIHFCSPFHNTTRSRYTPGPGVVIAIRGKTTDFGTRLRIRVGRL